MTRWYEYLSKKSEPFLFFLLIPMAAFFLRSSYSGLRERGLEERGGLGLLFLWLTSLILNLILLNTCTKSDNYIFTF